MESGLAGWVQTIGYIGIFVVVFAETGLLVGFALPGDSLLITVGILGAAGKLQLFPAITALFIGSFLGNNLGYWLGRWAGPGLQRRVRADHLERTQLFMRRFGALSLLVGPFIPIVRALVPFVCGTLRMPYGRFLPLTLLGSLIWTVGLTLFSYWVGSKIPNLEKYVYLILLVGISAGVVPAAIRFFRRRSARSVEM
ncbi:MAG: DedA family protein [Thermaceae bacterium]|nr:DedA family protein [Thermaceae bacterium]